MLIEPQIDEEERLRIEAEERQKRIQALMEKHNRGIYF